MLFGMATKFLVCGTLAEPYEGLQHTGQEPSPRSWTDGSPRVAHPARSKYEVTDELPNWLLIYQSVSDKTADQFCDELGINRSVAKRDCPDRHHWHHCWHHGIEPILPSHTSVGAERDTLAHQYVVDSAAQEMIDVYGADGQD